MKTTPSKIVIGLIILLAISITATVMFRPKDEQPTAKPSEAINSEEYNKLVIILNEICPTRQDIKQCKEWCTRVDCKE